MNKPRRAPRHRVDGVLLFDKPLGMSSNAALQRVRWLFNAEKAGHTGTLDPLATGLLPLCFGEATKFAGELLDADKTYLATVQLGIVTDTADAAGRVLSTQPVATSEVALRGLLPQFMGEIEQIPPMYSALKRDGQPLYALARQGIEVERQARRVRIHALELSNWTGDRFDLRVECSKGTYVRTLAADLGEALGCGAHLAALRRCRVGKLDIEHAVTLATVEGTPVEARPPLLLPMDTLLTDLPVIELNEADTACLLHGQPVRREGMMQQRGRLYGPRGFIGLGELAADGLLQPKRLIASR